MKDVLCRKLLKDSVNSMHHQYRKKSANRDSFVYDRFQPFFLINQLRTVRINFKHYAYNLGPGTQPDRRTPQAKAR